MNPASVAATLLSVSRRAERLIEAEGLPVLVDGLPYREICGLHLSFSFDRGEAPAGDADAAAVLGELAGAYSALPPWPEWTHVDQRDVRALWEAETAEYIHPRRALRALAEEEVSRDVLSRRIVASHSGTCRTSLQVLLRASGIEVVGNWRSQLVCPLLPLDLLCATADAAAAAVAGLASRGWAGETPPVRVSCHFASSHVRPGRGSWQAGA